MPFFIAFFLLLFLVGCTPSPQAPNPLAPETDVPQKSLFERFGEGEDFERLLELFRYNCTATLTQKLYPKACHEALAAKDAKAFFESHFELKRIEPNAQRSLLTGYYEPLLKGSLRKSERFKYPVYGKPRDLRKILLENGHTKKGRSVKGKMLPYFTRAQIATRKMDAEILCYVEDKIDLFFMEVQGSGRVELEDGRVIFIGYADSNGHGYVSLGRVMIDQGIFQTPDEVSLQSIRAWLEKNPSRIDALLNTNPSYVFFRRMPQRATGSLGVVLTPERSVAVDKQFIPLGAMLAIKSDSELYAAHRFVFAQDTGGAIKGPNRADLFMGYGEYAQWIAGGLKAPLEIWMMHPKD